MDWNFKASSSWDLTGFEQEAVPIDGSDKLTNTGDHVTGSHARCSIDLKLGEVTDSSNETLCSWKQPRVLKAENLHPSGSTKRPRPTANGSQPVSCLVDGCVSDLSNCREYHRRHKVCEAHSKTSQVSIGGQTQRFCQQCSRFHSLDKFDEVKRSCRKRLDGHNRRRRKPQPDPLFRSVNSLSYSQGTPLFPFSSPHVYPSAAVVNPTWSAVSEADAGRYNSLNQHMHFPDKQFPFFQGDNPILNNQTSHETTICQSITLSPSVDAGRRIQVQDTDCALSLLSAKPTHSTIPGNQTKQHPDNSIHWMNPPNQNVHGHSLGPIDSLLVSSSRDAGDDVQGSSGMFVVGSSTYSSGTKADQTLPFSWE